MLRRKKIAGVSRPFLLIQDKLDFEDDGDTLSQQDDATRLTLQVLSEELLHDLTCPHCREKELDFDPDTPVIIDDDDDGEWEE